MGKGGARHFSKPPADAGFVLKVLSDNVKQLADMGQYESISRNSPFNLRGLMENADLRQGLLKIEPTAEIHTQSLTAATLKLTDEPSLNKTKFQGCVWITLRMERITTILNHVRKLANDPEGFKILCL